MENTLENKSKFFAQYWGQKLRIYPLTVSILKWELTSDRIDCCKNLSLGLTPLSSITDEDAIKVVEILKSIGVLSSAMREPQKFLEPLKNGKGTIQLILPVADYLRSKGYALPYMGLSTEKQIEYGWIKLIE